MGAGPSVPVVSLLTDYGLADGFVGALHSVIRSRLPTVPIVDLTHEIPPGDVRTGAAALARAAAYVAPGVVVAVVDPGVGTRRRGVALKTAGSDVYLVGPDNGLLAPAADRLGGVAAAVELKVRFPAVATSGPTFDGRDVFAPAAALLAEGHDMHDLGPELAGDDLVRLEAPVSRARADGWWELEVTWVDRFGNVELAAGPGDIWPSGETSPGGSVTVRPVEEGPAGNGRARQARVVRAFGDLGPSEVGLLVDSDGHLALCLNGSSAANRLGLKETDVVLVRPDR